MAALMVVAFFAFLVVAACCGYLFGRSAGYDAGYSDRMTEEVRRVYFYR
jgi:hypothetical protein